MPSPIESGGATSPFGLSSVLSIDVLLESDSQFKWGGQVGTGADLSYSFPAPGAVWVGGYANGIPNAVSFLSVDYQANARLAIAAWSNVANIGVTEVADAADNVGDIRFAYSTALSNSALAFSPSIAPEGGDLWIDPNLTSDGESNPGGFGFEQLLHELGHALGLAHPFEGAVTLPAHLDSVRYTVMSYTQAVGHGNFALDFAPTTPMLFDIQAIQFLYGANMGFHAGDDTYTYEEGQKYYQTIWDAGGTDTIQYMSSTHAAVIDLRPGGFSRLGTPLTVLDGSGAQVHETVAVAFNVTIENAMGGAAGDTIYGNAISNPLLRGDGGADAIYGGAGDDWIEGEAGVNPFSGVAGADLILGEAGNDVVLGGPGNDTIAGGAGIDTLLGDAGNDIIAGEADTDYISGGEGDDTLHGQLGNDVVFGDLGNDIVYGGDGDDIMMGELGDATVSVGGIDVLYGEAGNDSIHGGANGDGIDGGVGNDLIDGGNGSDAIAGGLGVDLMIGSGMTQYTSGQFPAGTSGDDVFIYYNIYEAGDQIYGFDTRAGNADKLYLVYLFDSLGYAGMNPRGDGYLRVEQNGADTQVQIDADGAGGGPAFNTLVSLMSVTATTIDDSFFYFQ